MLKCDRWIIEQSLNGMIAPFVQHTNFAEGRKVISYGLSSYGYDLRLSPKSFKVFRYRPKSFVDPKQFDENLLEDGHYEESDLGGYFVLPGYTYALGVTVERLTMPSNVLALCIGKSTYARAGIIVNCTPIEPQWQGHITLEFSNSGPSEAHLYANEGIAQLIFLEGEQCLSTYADRIGKYQNQPNSVVLPKV